MAGGGVHGQIDRIDLGPPGEALVQDYKSGAKVDGGKRMLERGKLQLQLYLLAAREVWGLELAGGLYRPLGARNEATARPRACCGRSSGRSWPDSTRGPATSSTTRPSKPPSTRRDKAEEIISLIQAGEHPPPRSAAAARATARSSRSAGANAASPRRNPCPRRRRRSERSEPTSSERRSTERDRDVFLRAGAGTGKTTVLVDRFCAAALDPGRRASSGSSPSPSPSAPRTSSAAASARSSRARAARRPRATSARPLLEAAGGERAGLDLDHPRLLPPPAGVPSCRRRDRPALPGRRRVGGRPARGRRVRLRARGDGRAADSEALELAAANRPPDPPAR